MNRVDFTRKISWLMVQMGMEGEKPIEDYCKRSDEEQYRLYQIGREFDNNGNVIKEDKNKTVTNCDGKKNVSAHQRGRAKDILFISADGKRVVAPKRGYDYWHRRWERMGGKPAIKWDQAHFEG